MILWRHRYTTPMPPSPITSSTLYRLSIVYPMSALVCACIGNGGSLGVGTSPTKLSAAARTATSFNPVMRSAPSLSLGLTAFGTRASGPLESWLIARTSKDTSLMELCVSSDAASRHAQSPESVCQDVCYGGCKRRASDAQHSNSSLLPEILPAGAFVGTKPSANCCTPRRARSG